MNELPLKTKIDHFSLFMADVPCKQVDFGPVWGISVTRTVYFYAPDGDEALEFIRSIGGDRVFNLDLNP